MAIRNPEGKPTQAPNINRVNDLRTSPSNDNNSPIENTDDHHFDPDTLNRPDAFNDAMNNGARAPQPTGAGMQNRVGDIKRSMQDGDPSGKSNFGNFLNTPISKALATVGVAAVATGGVFLGVKASGNDTENHPGTRAELTAPLIPGNIDLDNDGKISKEEFTAMSPDEFHSLPYEQRLAFAKTHQEYVKTASTFFWKDLDSRQLETLTGGADYHNPDAYMPDLSAPRDTWSDDDYLRYFAASMYAESAVLAYEDPNETPQERSERLAKDETNTLEGKKLFSLAMSPSFRGFDAKVNRIGNKIESPEGVINVYRTENPTTELGLEVRQQSIEYLVSGNNTLGITGRLVYGHFVNPAAAPQYAEKDAKWLFFADTTTPDGTINTQLVNMFTTSEAADFIDELKNGTVEIEQ